MNSQPIDRFYLIDLDRTIFDTDKASLTLLRIVADYDSALAERIEQNLASFTGFGVAYSVRDAIAEVLGEETMQAVEQRFVDEAADAGFLLPGARTLLEKVGERGGILTYGAPAGQGLKLRAVGLADYPHLITDEPHKGRLIASWKRADGLFYLPAQYGNVVARSVVLVDDRAQSFDELPEGAGGYWLNSEPMAALDVVPIPEVVQRIDSLDSVVV